jgi:hypothetical protein
MRILRPMQEMNHSRGAQATEIAAQRRRSSAIVARRSAIPIALTEKTRCRVRAHRAVSRISARDIESGHDLWKTR